MKDTYFLTTGSNEWLLTNKIGGYALGTGNLINQRKYHGLLIAADDNGNRNSLLSGLEIMIEWRGGIFYIDSTNYSNCIYPEGFLHLVKSWLRPYPVFLYSTLHHNDDILVMVELRMADFANTLLVTFTNLGHHKLHFHIRPKLTLRNHHHINQPGCWDNGHIDLECNQNTFTVNKVNSNLTISGTVGSGNVICERVSYHNVYYPWEAIRGYYGVEDLLSPVLMTFDLPAGKTENLIFTDRDCINNTDNHNSLSPQNINATIETIEKKYAPLPKPNDYPGNRAGTLNGTTEGSSVLQSLDYHNRNLFELQDYLTILELSLNDFLLKDNIIAGYPWFGCWGRDTFITLEAAVNSIGNPLNTLNTHSSQMIPVIKEIFVKYGSLINNGLLPNMLPESGQAGNYDSIDSCLWFIIRLKQFLDKLKDQTPPEDSSHKDFVVTAISYCDQIIHGLFSNESYPFHICEDGLLYLEQGFASATWMDAKIDGKAVTPRTGAPVEINALFYNALSSYLDLAASAGHRIVEEKSISTHLVKLKKAFAQFITEDYLADRIEDGKQVLEYRPNAIIAVSLPYHLISLSHTKTVLATAKAKLLTEYGLRTLSPDHYRFNKKYLGNQTERDSQYHQGTVWTFLLYPYAAAYFRAYEKTKSSRALQKDLESIISTLRDEYLKGHLASLAEIRDGYRPKVSKGCPAQAWSVAALYNIECLISSL